ncbi:MAG: hypothetical protein F6K65_14775 [Moorea sp. SIO3C2]|nr:hypothetical protein [Moorena sp. SIO3C2]
MRSHQPVSLVNEPVSLAVEALSLVLEPLPPLPTIPCSLFPVPFALQLKTIAMLRFLTKSLFPKKSLTICHT